jgi:hypothetical protein
MRESHRGFQSWRVEQSVEIVRNNMKYCDFYVVDLDYFSVLGDFL